LNLRKEKKINIEIDKEIIKNYLSLFIKGFLLNVINIVYWIWMAVIISVGPKLEMENSRMLTFSALLSSPIY
jgi:hypothetical protein